MIQKSWQSYGKSGRFKKLRQFRDITNENYWYILSNLRDFKKKLQSSCQNSRNIETQT